MLYTLFMIYHVPDIPDYVCCAKFATHSLIHVRYHPRFVVLYFASLPFLLRGFSIFIITSTTFVALFLAIVASSLAIAFIGKHFLLSAIVLHRQVLTCSYLSLASIRSFVNPGYHICRHISRSHL
jgi:hypothetical protein